VFLHAIKNTPIERRDELFDLIQHYNRLLLFKFLRGSEGPATAAWWPCCAARLPAIGYAFAPLGVRLARGLHRQILSKALGSAQCRLDRTRLVPPVPAKPSSWLGDA